MKQSNRELWLALIAMIAITLMYLFVAATYGQIPGASDLFGHGIGIIGFILMLMTETLYSLRKRSKRARWGRMAEWLKFHIFTGLVGPYLVLFHSSWKFNGLAGLVMLFTVIIVISGILGRYIYTSVPRNTEGLEIDDYELERQILVAETELQSWLSTHPAQYRTLTPVSSLNIPVDNTRLVFGRVFDEWSSRLRWWRETRKLDKETRLQAQQLNSLIKRQRTLRRQLSSIVVARRMLGLWHEIHIPIGMVLFIAAFIHIIAAIYYATLLH